MRSLRVSGGGVQSNGSGSAIHSSATAQMSGSWHIWNSANLAGPPICVKRLLLVAAAAGAWAEARPPACPDFAGPISLSRRVKQMDWEETEFTMLNDTLRKATNHGGMDKHSRLSAQCAYVLIETPIRVTAGATHGNLPHTNSDRLSFKTRHSLRQRLEEGTWRGTRACSLRRPGRQRCGCHGIQVITQEVEMVRVWRVALQQVVKDGSAVCGLKGWQLSRCGSPLRGLRRCDGGQTFPCQVTLQQKRSSLQTWASIERASALHSDVAVKRALP